MKAKLRVCPSTNQSIQTRFEPKMTGFRNNGNGASKGSQSKRSARSSRVRIDQFQEKENQGDRTAIPSRREERCREDKKGRYIERTKLDISWLINLLLSAVVQEGA